MTIPFTKAHGAKNDFLLTWETALAEMDLTQAAVSICDRHTGVGADGWLVVSRGSELEHAVIRLFNADGSEVEMSGNGTRCAAAFLLDEGEVTATEIRIMTGAGRKHLRLIEALGNKYSFEMNMGKPWIDTNHLHHQLQLSTGPLDVTIVNVGNPQCVVFVDDFSVGWRQIGPEIERHEYFPKRTNVSFVRVVDEHTIEVRFFERGVGETMSSGTGSTGAAAAALARGPVKEPVRVITPAGPLDMRRDGGDLFLVGPAEIVAKGEFIL